MTYRDQQKTTASPFRFLMVAVVVLGIVVVYLTDTAGSFLEATLPGSSFEITSKEAKYPFNYEYDGSDTVSKLEHHLTAEIQSAATLSEISLQRERDERHLTEMQIREEQHEVVADVADQIRALELDLRTEMIEEKHELEEEVADQRELIRTLRNDLRTEISERRATTERQPVEVPRLSAAPQPTRPRPTAPSTTRSRRTLSPGTWSETKRSRTKQTISVHYRGRIVGIRINDRLYRASAGNGVVRVRMNRPRPVSVVVEGVGWEYEFNRLEMQAGGDYHLTVPLLSPRSLTTPTTPSGRWRLRTTIHDLARRPLGTLERKMGRWTGGL
jgi:hypothetical protein